MQEAEQLLAEREVEEILNEFFGDRPIPERTCGVDKRHLIWDERRYMGMDDTVVSSPVA
jgi:hypothetical protein